MREVLIKIWRSIFETWFPSISSLACKWSFPTIALAGPNRSSRKAGRFPVTCRPSPGELTENRPTLQAFSETFRESFRPSLRVVSDISGLRCVYYVVYYLDSILHRHQYMPSFGFKLPIFIFAAVSTLTQTAPGQPA